MKITQTDGDTERPKDQKNTVRNSNNTKEDEQAKKHNQINQNERS